MEFFRGKNDNFLCLFSPTQSTISVSTEESLEYVSFLSKHSERLWFPQQQMTSFYFSFFGGKMYCGFIKSLSSWYQSILWQIVTLPQKSQYIISPPIKWGRKWQLERASAALGYVSLPCIGSPVRPLVRECDRNTLMWSPITYSM